MELELNWATLLFSEGLRMVFARILNPIFINLL